jgi:soluble lytic murein transglycosylase-like protein
MGRTLKFSGKLVLGIVAVLTFPWRPASAAELAVLRNGSTIRCQGRQNLGTEVRLYIADAPGSYVDVAAEDIARFENDDRIPPRVEISAASPGQSTPMPTTLDEIIQDASRRNNLDRELIRSVIRTESNFRVDAVSPKGARGLMQLMPETAEQLGIVDVFDPSENVEGGARYLRQLLDRFGGDLTRALAAYNAGPARVEQYNGVPPFAETRMYVSRITADLDNKKIVAVAGKQVLASRRIARKAGPAPASESGELLAEARTAADSGR